MRRHHGLIAAMGGLALLAASATAKDSTKASLTNPNPADTAGPFVDCLSSGRVQSKGGAGLSIQMKKLQGVTDGDQAICTPDDYICVIDNVNSILQSPSQLIVRGDVKSGAIKIKHDLCGENSNFCASTPTSIYAADLRCFKPDASYAPTFVSGFALPSGCEGLVFPAGPVPSSALVARGGVTDGCM